MQKIIPFKKEMPFKSEVAEITSISLEHTLHKEKENQITGIFTVSGDYKVIDTSNVIDHFSFELPFHIEVDSKYDLEKAHIDIDDFYYEIINNKNLMIHIDVLLDKIEEVKVREEKDLVLEALEKKEKELEEEKKLEEQRSVEPIVEKIQNIETEENVSNINNVSTIEEKEHIEKTREEKEVEPANIETVSSIFDDFDKSVSVSSIYKVYMVREEDSLESILAKYKITKEELEKYNNLKEMKKGDKLIIPSIEIEKV